MSWYANFEFRVTQLDGTIVAIEQNDCTMADWTLPWCATATNSTGGYMKVRLRHCFSLVFSLPFFAKRHRHCLLLVFQLPFFAKRHRRCLSLVFSLPFFAKTVPASGHVGRVRLLRPGGARARARADRRADARAAGGPAEPVRAVAHGRQCGGAPRIDSAPAAADLCVGAVRGDPEAAGPSDVRHCLCLVFTLPSWLYLWLVFPLPLRLRQCLCLRSPGRPHQALAALCAGARAAGQALSERLGLHILRSAELGARSPAAGQRASLLLPAAACCCLLLPAAACCCLLLPAAACSCLRARLCRCCLSCCLSHVRVVDPRRGKAAASLDTVKSMSSVRVD